MRQAYAFFAVLAVLLVSRAARAELWEAPVGGRPLPLGEARVVCKVAALEAGWTTDPDGHELRPPASADAIGKLVTFKVAASQAACATSGATMSAVAVGARAQVDNLTLDVDGGRILAQGRKLRGAVLRWATHTRTGSDVCAAPQTVAVGESCAFSSPRDLPADPSFLKLDVFPPGTSLDPEMVVFDAQGVRTAEGTFEVHAVDVSLHQLVPPDASVDLSSGTGHVPLVHPDAVASVSCVDAACSIEGTDLVVRSEHGADDQLDVHLQLRAHAFYHGASGPADQAPTIIVPLQRCPVSIASAAVVSNVDEERVVVRVDGTCARADWGLSVTTDEGTGRIERTELLGGALYAVVHLPHPPTDTLVLTVRRRGTVLGTARSPVKRIVWRTRLELEGHGSVDFLPTNRWAKVLVPSSPHGTGVDVLPIDGVYETRRDEAGASFVRAIEGASGSTPLRLGLVDKTLPAPLLGTVLAEANEPVDRSIRVANVPVALGAAVLDKDPLVELDCGDGSGQPARVRPGVTSQIAYRARDTCHLVFHRERLKLEDGTQRLHVTVSVTGSDGTSRPDAHVEQTVLLHAEPKVRTMAITGATDPFDRFSIKVGNSSDLAEGAAEQQDKQPADAQWSVVTGKDHARLYGTTAIPTGLFRVSDQANSGILTISAGALMRLVALSRDGIAFPLGLEAGVMWMGIAGEATTSGTQSSVSPYGQVAIVAGTGIAIPIANASHASQTAISLHAWFEYEVSRSITHQSGNPVGFVFGPSISIGDVGTNF